MFIPQLKITPSRNLLESVLNVKTTTLEHFKALNPDTYILFAQDITLVKDRIHYIDVCKDQVAGVNYKDLSIYELAFKTKYYLDEKIEQLGLEVNANKLNLNNIDLNIFFVEAERILSEINP